MASEMIAGGVPVTVVSERMGHASKQDDARYLLARPPGFGDRCRDLPQPPLPHLSAPRCHQVSKFAFGHLGWTPDFGEIG